MQKKKIVVTQRQIELLAENEFAKLSGNEDESSDTTTNSDTDAPSEDEPAASSGLDNMIGEPGDRRIEYPSPGDVEALKMDGGAPEDSEGQSDEIDPKDMKSPPHELLEYLDKLEEAKSILSKVAAKEDNDNIKNRIYSHYEKAQKLAFELIKEFGIVH